MASVPGQGMASSFFRIWKEKLAAVTDAETQKRLEGDRASATLWWGPEGISNEVDGCEMLRSLLTQ